MRLAASDLVTMYRPSFCQTRILHRERHDPEVPPSAFEEVLSRLGLRHEQKHLASLGKHYDLSSLAFPDRVQRTMQAITERVFVIYQPAFEVNTTIDGIQVEVVGMPDFLIRDGEGYIVRDSKLPRHIDGENHIEIRLLMQLYGWLFERTIGHLPKALQVHSGTGDIVDVPYDGGFAALAALSFVLEAKQQAVTPYEPVGWSKCSGCGFKPRCWAESDASADVAVVPEIDQSLARALHNSGTSSRKELLAKFDVKTLSEFKRPVGGRDTRVGKKAVSILYFTEALETGQERFLAFPAIPLSDNYVMFDLKGMPPHVDELDKIYLWGMQVFGRNPIEFLPAVAGFGGDGDRDGWFGFLTAAKQIFDQYGDIPFVHWASYEKAHVTSYTKRYGDQDGTAARVVRNLIDLYRVTKDSVVLPLPSFSLKVIETYVGYTRSQNEYGGDWSMATFIEATETSDVMKRQELMDTILQYNREDLEAMWAVFKWLRSKKPTSAISQ
jgi:predicted RecB family nuclease